MNEDIITALKNGIERGESLQTAMNILIDSGYNPREIEEASRYVGAGAIQFLKQNSEEELIMPENKGFFNFKKTNKENKPSQGFQEQIKQKINPKQNIAPRQLPSDNFKIKKPNFWIKEIILLMILILLIGALIGTIFFKDKILSFLS